MMDEMDMVDAMVMDGMDTMWTNTAGCPYAPLSVFLPGFH